MSSPLTLSSLRPSLSSSLGSESANDIRRTITFANSISDASPASWKDECLDVCERLRKRISQGCSPYAPEMVSTLFGQRKTTVGIMVDGLTIDNMVIGGPAYNSGQLDRGDLIVAVDFKSVSEESLQDLLVGPDIPLSSVTLTVIKSGSTTVTRDVVLTRKAMDSIADRCRMFEMFAAMKVTHSIVP